eukprot:7968925-Lingulodinium_polyedra.AAC.1
MSLEIGRQDVRALRLVTLDLLLCTSFLCLFSPHARDDHYLRLGAALGSPLPRRSRHLFQRLSGPPFSLGDSPHGPRRDHRARAPGDAVRRRAPVPAEPDAFPPSWLEDDVVVLRLLGL